MKERPILFSGGMVRAILDGRKTQTRRAINPQPIADGLYHEYKGIPWLKTGDPFPFIGHLCPYGTPNDLLWVRETWNAVHFCPEYSEGYRTGYSDDWFESKDIPKNSNQQYWTPCYKADDHSDGLDIKWRPSIFMPRWASRILLEVTDVRVERVQEISDGDAIKEGIHDVCHCGDYVESHGYHSGHGAVSMPGWATENFASLWDSINGKRGYPWALNPWVWVIEFQKVK